jgi:hypothetical protein
MPVGLTWYPFQGLAAYFTKRGKLAIGKLHNEYLCEASLGIGTRNIRLLNSSLARWDLLATDTLILLRS